MAKPHTNNSFSYKVTHPIIKGVLDSRSKLDNTVQVAMPFIKATTTIRLPEFLGSSDNIGFTLGMHAIPEDVRMEDMYSNQDGNALIGYTYNKSGHTERVYADTSAAVVQFGKVFDVNGNLFENNGASYIPPPGITSATIGRNKSGFIHTAQINFTVPYLSQLEMLHRTFLIPGVGMVLEWGNQYAKEKTSPEDFGESGLTDPIIDQIMFPWYNRSKLMNMLDRLAKDQVGLEEIMQCYVYPTQGQYMWMFGRVANFSISGQSGDGSFECSVKIVGPSEDSWAYSTRNTVIPPRKSFDARICPDGTNSVESYFTTTSPGLNFKTLVESTYNSKPGEDLYPWKNHVKYFKQGNMKKDGEPKKDKTTDPTISEEMFADSENAYFVTWRFFVNVVLNNNKWGIKAIFKNAFLTDAEMDKVSLLRPYDGGPDSTVHGEYENYVGSNENLRSTDPSTMIIVNNTAADIARSNMNLVRQGFGDELTKFSEKAHEFSEQGDFYSSDLKDRGFLSTGVWLNHKAIAQSMASSNTILQGIVNVLERMNSATQQYWQLAIDASDPLCSVNCGGTQSDLPAGLSSINYSIVDIKYKENSDIATTEFLENVHVFNKYIRQNGRELVGSDTIECNVSLDMPKLMFAQIATLGLPLSQEDVGETAEEPILGQNANDTLRKIFGITSIHADDDATSIDLTTLSKKQRQELLAKSTCSTVGSQTTAGTAGHGNKTYPLTLTDVDMSNEKELDRIKKQAEDIVNSDKYKTCRSPGSVIPSSNTPRVLSPSFSSESTLAKPTPSVTPVAQNDAIFTALNKKEVSFCSTLSDPNEKRFCDNVTQRHGITDSTEVAQMMAQFKQESGLKYNSVVNLNFSAQVLYSQWNVSRRAGLFTSLEEAEALCCNKNPQALANKIFQNQVGNGNEASGDGWKFRARGFTQLFGRANYESASKYFGRDFVSNPDAIIQDYDTGVDIAVWYWNTRVKKRILDAGTTFDDTATATAAIYGSASKESGIDRRIEFFDKYKKILTGNPAIAVVPLPTPVNPSVLSSPECDEYNRAVNVLAQIKDVTENVNKLTEQKGVLTREFPGLKEVYRYIEPFADWMVANIARSADGNSSNAFGASPGTLSISADLTLPGIAGIRIGELFWIDRIPAFYRAYGAFQVLGLEDILNDGAWQTKITARFNYLGEMWKSAATKKLI